MLHLGTDEVEHLVVPVCQCFVLQLPAEVIHLLVLVGINRQPGNSAQPLMGQFQIGAAIGVEQLFSSNVSFIGLYLRIKKGPALCRPDVAKRPPCVVQGGQGCDIVSDENQLGLDNLLGTVADAVHPAHPFQLIGGFQGFSHALSFLHLPDGQCKLFLGLLVQLGKIAVQFTGQEQLVVPDGVLLLQICLM